MESSKAEGKRNMEAEEDEEEEDEDGVAEDYNKRRAVAFTGRKVTTTTTTLPVGCQVENCAADMKNAKPYHRRHKVCEQHSKASAVDFFGISKRFCQQCSRFHEISEFDENKRSCRRRLAGHNERRRKSSHDSSGGEA